MIIYENKKEEFNYYKEVWKYHKARQRYMRNPKNFFTFSWWWEFLGIPIQVALIILVIQFLTT